MPIEIQSPELQVWFGGFGGETLQI